MVKLTEQIYKKLTISANGFLGNGKEHQGRIIMTTLTLDAKYIDVLQALGSLEETLEEAVRRYAIERIGERIGNLQHEILNFQTKYGLPYQQFYAQITNDDKFVQSLREMEPTWERDLNAWEYYTEELAEWLGHLESISRS